MDPLRETPARAAGRAAAVGTANLRNSIPEWRVHWVLAALLRRAGGRNVT